MEEKSIDELRREAQELYQAKLLAYQQSQKQEPKQVVKEPSPVKEVAKSAKPEFLKIKLPLIAAVKNPVGITPEKASRPKNNWFVVIVFTLLTIVVLVKVMVIRP